ncbi:MAG: autoinducer binding domain-containing protein [Gammaproteobacteria bacterium]|jgi:DNA-binding CsgD family transcriptional regulator|nr:autoinducer binding domain-containing protein [Gammaproteobacteria bacterium]
MKHSLVLDKTLNDLMEASDLAQDEHGIKQALRNFTTAAGFDRFAYLNVRADNVWALSTYPAEWQHIYLDNNYATIDPVVTIAKRTMQPFVWSQNDNAGTAPETKRFFGEAADFGICSGVSIPVRGGFGRVAMLTLTTDKSAVDFVEIRNVTHAITAVAFVHVHLNRLVSAQHTPTIELTPRQSLCLAWASMGKTMDEIADLLGISERAVRFYIKGARDRLGATNITHAVRLATERNLI